MRSSTMISLRAGVMLFCLVVVPLFAISGTSATKVLKSLVFGETAESDNPAHAENSGAGLSPLALGANALEPAPADGSGAEPVDMPVAGSGQPLLQSKRGVQREIEQVDFEAEAYAAGEYSNAPAGRLYPGTEYPGTGHPNSGHSGQEISADMPREEEFQPDPRARTPREDHQPQRLPPALDRFQAIQERLRDLGATYYLLETWGKQGELYRFHCKLAASANGEASRRFEATDADSLQVMERVLEQVEAWRAVSSSR